MEIIKRKAIRLSIDHWLRMIKWVETQGKYDLADKEKMRLAIGEEWSGDFCQLCRTYTIRTTCDECPLYKRYGGCSSSNKSAWWRACRASTWEKWLDAAQLMVKQLRSCLK